MKHLVTTFSNISLFEARRELAEAHDYLVTCARTALSKIPTSGSLWGISMKRLDVHLAASGRPGIVRKDSERLGEVINMIATIERLTAAIEWFQNTEDFKNLRVSECHPSTSSAKGSNDLMLAAEDGRLLVRCEVCDVASKNAGQNKKEPKDLASLGCAEAIPNDGVRRFICTSPEFAGAINGARRKWEKRRYRYRAFSLGDPGGTLLLEVIPGPLSSGV